MYLGMRCGTNSHAAICLPLSLSLSLLQLLELVLQVVTLYYGGHLVIYGEMTGGELVSLLLYQVSLTAALDVSFCALYRTK